MIGARPGHSAAADGWGSVLCMKITNRVSWWIPTKISSTATAVAAAGTRRAQIHVVDYRPELVDRHHVGGYRSDVQAEIRRNRFAVRQVAGPRPVHAPP